MINSKDYLRQVGISEEQFSFLLKRLEQEIERPIKKQKSYYSGKKTTHYEGSAIGFFGK